MYDQDNVRNWMLPAGYGLLFDGKTATGNNRVSDGLGRVWYITKAGKVRPLSAGAHRSEYITKEIQLALDNPQGGWVDKR